MNAEEFIEQYGKIEMMKIMKMEEQKEQKDKGLNESDKEAQRIPRNTQTTPSRSSKNLVIGAEIKEKMR